MMTTTKSIDLDNLQNYFLLGGVTGNDLWPTINIVLLSYIVLLFLPRWRWTPILTLIIPLFHSVLYVGSLFSFMLDPKEDTPKVEFGTFEEIVTLFKDPDVIFPAWIHYIVFDHLVSRQIVLDSVHRGTSLMGHFLIVVPCVFSTFMFGPTGFLLYMILRQIFLPASCSDEEKIKIL
jgi:Domain of unknown function (DUF4281)